MEKVIIYANETCPYCKQVKEELTKNEIEFENRLTKDFEKQWGNIIDLTGMPTIPTIIYKDNYFVPGRDFNSPAQLVNIFKNFNPSNHAVEAKLLERVKTLTFQIQTAFGRTDQLLRQIENKLNTEKDEHKSTD